MFPSSVSRKDDVVVSIRTENRRETAGLIDELPVTIKLLQILFGKPDDVTMFAIWRERDLAALPANTSTSSVRAANSFLAVQHDDPFVAGASAVGIA